MKSPVRVYNVADVIGCQPRELRDWLNRIFPKGDRYPTTSSRIEPTLAIAIVGVFNPDAIPEKENGSEKR